MEVEFAAAASKFADFNIKMGANVAGFQNGGEMCRDGGKFRRLLHTSERLHNSESHICRIYLYLHCTFRLLDEVD